MGAGTVLRVGVTLGVQASDPVPTEFFGVNMLAGRDSPTGSFRDKIVTLGATHLRWPGGGIAETGFDLTRPEAIEVDGAAERTLAGYLDLCARLDMRPVIVLPTKRYAGDPDGAAADLAAFLDRLKAGEFGDARDAVFEIGNEYYAASGPYGPMSAADYGEIAARFATMIEQALPRAEIAVQAGKWPAHNRAILAAFDQPAERAAVDALVFHEYPWTLEAVPDRIAAKAALAAEWTAAGISADLYMSEWNVGSHPDKALDPRHDYGLAQPSTLLEIATEALRAGVDRASIWGVQQRNKTSLTADEGDGRIFAAGLLFGMMAESLPGKRLVDLDMPDDPALRVHAFESRTEITVFIAARDLAEDEVTVRLDLRGLTTSLAHLRGERLSMSGDPLAYRPEGTVETILPGIGEDGTVSVTLDADWQIIRLTFARAVDDLIGQLRPRDPLSGGGAAQTGPIAVEARIGEAGNDLLRGAPGRDRLTGGRGNDVLQGLDGNDWQSGGSGNDVLDGGMGRDRLAGNSGNDRLSGGWGADRLSGGDGTDWLDGGAGDDILRGGAGADVFVLAPGTGTDAVLDFTPGEDLIDLSATAIGDFAALSEHHLFAREAGTLILCDEGRLFLRGIAPGDLSDGDFLF
ncbi:MAG: hypothetical protein KatS3mg118_0877 [Paracoccaceae bacterium]|nr:MAG: hypothetical protein KatS3mg118_0877 [Paracoccaceae bacterium]